MAKHLITVNMKDIKAAMPTVITKDDKKHIGLLPLLLILLLKLDVV